MELLVARLWILTVQGCYRVLEAPKSDPSSTTEEI